MKKDTQGNAPAGAVYGLGLIGAAVYFISQATSFWIGVIGFLKAIVWPAFLVYEAFKHFGMWCFINYALQSHKSWYHKYHEYLIFIKTYSCNSLTASLYLPSPNCFGCISNITGNLGCLLHRQLEEVTKIIFSIIHDYYLETALTAVKTGIVVSYQSYGDLMRWNPHYHCIVLEGGIDFISHSSCLFTYPLCIMPNQM